MHKGREIYQAERQYDPDLTPKGIQQAETTGKFISQQLKISIDKIYTSPQQRALKTGQIIKEQINKDFYSQQEFRQFQNYMNKGVSMKKIKHLKGIIDNGYQKFIEMYFKFQEHYKNALICESINDQGWYFLTQKENNDQAELRAVKMLVKFQKLLTTQNKYNNFIVITHGKYFSQILSLLTDISKNSSIEIRSSNTAISLVQLFLEKNGDVTYQLKYFNFIDHLNEDILSDNSKLIRNKFSDLHLFNERKLEI